MLYFASFVLVTMFPERCKNTRPYFSLSFQKRNFMVFPRDKVDGVVVWFHLEDIPMHFKCIIGSHTYHDNGEG